MAGSPNAEHLTTGPDAQGPATVAVLDVGKTNVKLTAATADGDIVETLSTPNEVKPGPPWRRHDLAGLSDWVFGSLAELSKRHSLRHFVAAGHGVGGVLVTADPNELSALPMIDYEQDPPDAIRDAYPALAGDFFDRGSNIMLKATHHARQMYWMQQAEPDAFAKARWFLSLPQYWAWRFSGVAASELSMLCAQSHLWNLVERRWSPIVRSQGWEGILPPFRFAWETLGPIRPDLARRHGLPKDLSILTGGHDSSLNLYRYQAAGFPDVCLVSSGTWIVGMCAATPVKDIDPARGMVMNSDLSGRIVGGALTMGGREYSIVAGTSAEGPDADPETMRRIIARGSFALPSFSDDDGLFPGSAGKGRFVGPPAANDVERRALAVLYTALLSVECINALGGDNIVVLDGTSLRDPLYASVIAALRAGRETFYNLDSQGIAAGAALLTGHETRTRPARVSLETPQAFPGEVAALRDYARRWRELAGTQISISIAS